MTIIANPGSQVLYRNASGLEKAFADTDAVRLMALYAEAIIDVWDPWKIDVKYLPYLAWAMGVNYWDDEWRDVTKRAWTARQWEFKSLRGTEAGTRMAIDFSGRDVAPFGHQVLGFTAPPQKVFSGPSLTRAEREKWIAALPQIRVWRTYERGVASRYKLFTGGQSSGHLHNRRFMTPRAFPVPSTALQRLHRRARYVVNGVETDTTITEFGDFWQVHIRSIEDSKVFCDRPSRPGRFFIPSDASRRLVTVLPTPTSSWRFPVTPTLEPVTAEPERVVVPGTRGHRVFCNTQMRDRAFYIPSDAWSRIFSRFAINDGAAHVERRRPVQFMGVGRYGFPKYTFWVRVTIRSKHKWGVFDGIPYRQYFLPHDPRPVQRVKAAIRASKKLVDRSLLELGPVPRFVAGRPFIAGVDDFVVGHAF